MAGLFDIGDTEEEGRQNLGLLGLMGGLGMLQANGPGVSTGQAFGAGGMQGIQGMMQMQQMQQRAAQQKAMLQQGQQRMVPNSVREYEYAKQNGFEGTFEEYRTQAMGRNEVPANVRTYQFYKGLPDEEKTPFMNILRGNPYVNLGGSMALPNPAAPGQFIAETPKTVPPQDQPALRGAQALESGRGTTQATRESTAETKGINASNTLNILDGVEDLIDKSTGSYLGAGRDAVVGAAGFTTDGGEANAKLKVVQAGLMTTMPRMEGPQSDRDVQLYREAAGQIGDPTVPNGKKKAAVEMIRGLQKKYKDAAPSAKASGASGGWSIQRVD